MQRWDREWLLRPILAALGHGAVLASVGCGGIVGGSDELPGNDVADDSAAGGAAGTREPPSAPGGASGAGGGAGGGETTAPIEIWRWQTGAEPGAEPTEATQLTECRGVDGAVDEPLGPGLFQVSVADVSAFCGERVRDEELSYGLCLPPPAPGQTCADIYSLADIASIFECGLARAASLVCGARPPVPGAPNCAGDECCYAMVGGCPIGRPFLVQGQARVALLRGGDGWLAPLAERKTPELAALDPATRRALADVYAQDGLTEHASVASFARFTLECLALGAPAEIVLEAQRAASDEVEHARTSFALASAYAGAELGPATLDVSGALPVAPSREDAVLRTVREGCIAETVSAALLHEAAQAATDPAVKAALSRAADDEKRHSALSWRFVGWALESGGESLRAAVAREFGSARDHVGFGAFTGLPGDAAAMRAHGYLGTSERRQVAGLVLEQVVLPCARVLLNPPPEAPLGRGQGAPALTQSFRS
jgi:hypothetical protein